MQQEASRRTGETAGGTARNAHDYCITAMAAMPLSSTHDARMQTESRAQATANSLGNRPLQTVANAPTSSSADEPASACGMQHSIHSFQSSYGEWVMLSSFQGCQPGPSKSEVCSFDVGGVAAAKFPRFRRDGIHSGTRSASPQVGPASQLVAFLLGTTEPLGSTRRCCSMPTSGVYKT